ncbi:YbhB/YbcL family Raf kinase inhibitor-like protein [Amycolatopsis anabasis]|uniref:YbhB/YbcL family Raf kinase inhibitor-like protein n=1 Tax=Amycolatopsis anabasis TaxID=1840409 RepID=UPI00131CFAA8|nr:YbhB/YbcL family Raf kinase inhibitor-like protein [Amycolatopsis anabasis]
MELRSVAFGDQDLIPERYSYEGGNVSPPLEWSGVPGGTAELALLCEDPDAPGGTFTHWVLTGISPGTGGLAEGLPPADASPGRNGFGDFGWGGPRPPVGDPPHHYLFRLYAADRPLGLAAGADAGAVHTALDDHVLSEATLVGRFER